MRCLHRAPVLPPFLLSSPIRLCPIARECWESWTTTSFFPPAVQTCERVHVQKPTSVLHVHTQAFSPGLKTTRAGETRKTGACVGAAFSSCIRRPLPLLPPALHTSAETVREKQTSVRRGPAYVFREDDHMRAVALVRRPLLTLLLAPSHTPLAFMLFLVLFYISTLPRARRAVLAASPSRSPSWPR